MKALIFLVCAIGICQTAQFSSQINEKSWTGEAWSILCKQGALGRSNAEIAELIVEELTIVFFDSGRFSVYVNNEGSLHAFDVVDNSTMIEVVNGSLCAKDMVAIKINTALIGQCDSNTTIDKDSITKYLDLSLTSLVPAEPKSLIDAAKSAGNLGYEYQAIIASSDVVNAGISASTPTACDLKYTSSPWVLGYFGFNKIVNDYRAVASKKLIELLQADATTTNVAIAAGVLRALQEQIDNDYYWVVMVNDYIPEVNFASFIDKESWGKKNFNAFNLAGKNLLVTGLEGVASAFLQCTRPVDEDVMGSIVQNAIKDGNFNTVLQEIKKGSELVEFGSQVIIVINDANAAVDEFVFRDCQYEFSDATWTIFYYGIPHDEVYL